LELFDHRSPGQANLARSFLGAENQELASILLCPAVTSAFSAAVQARFPLALPATCICASCNHKEGTLEGFTATYGCKRLLYFEVYESIRIAIAREKQRKGWRREKKLNLIRTINSEFKDLAETWGWKMTSVHEKMYP
jgi:putative endonuclease